MPYADKAKQDAYRREWGRYYNRGHRKRPRLPKNFVVTEGTRMKIDELLDETLSLIEADLKKIRAEQAKAPAAIGAYAKVLIGYVQTLVMLRSDQLTAEQREKERLSKLTKEELDAEAEKALKKVRDSK